MALAMLAQIRPATKKKLPTSGKKEKISGHTAQLSLVRLRTLLEHRTEQVFWTVPINTHSTRLEQFDARYACECYPICYIKVIYVLYERP